MLFAPDARRPDHEPTASAIGRGHLDRSASGAGNIQKHQPEIGSMDESQRGNNLKDGTGGVERLKEREKTNQTLG